MNFYNYYYYYCYLKIVFNNQVPTYRVNDNVRVINPRPLKYLHNISLVILSQKNRF